jgi:hypothetical protein
LGTFDVENDPYAAWNLFSGNSSVGFKRDNMVLCQEALKEGVDGGLDKGLSARDADMTPTKPMDLIKDI